MSDSWPEGVDRLVLDTVDSTNAEAARRAPKLTRPLWIMGREQTGGRGRRGRPWVSPPGNLYASLLLPASGPVALMALRSFAAALALHDACSRLTGRAEAFTLKWPNDVLLHGGKLAGILLEGQGVRGVTEHLVIGMGVNLAHAPDAASVEAGALGPVSLLGETGLRIAPEDFLDALAPAFAHWEGRLAAEGFGPLRAAWLARAARLGEPIRARTARAELTGIFETVDDQGALVLRTATGPMAIAAADVFF